MCIVLLYITSKYPLIKPEIHILQNRKVVYYGVEMRAVCNSLMAVLVVVALFWGNCFSCPQILLAAQRHSCCPHGKADPGECQTQGLRNFVKAEQTAQIMPASLAAPAIADPLPVARLSTPLVVAAPPEYTPPDLLPLRI
jgi:hypothetical protein